MKRKELTTPFMVISNWKNPLVSMVYTKLFQRSKGLGEPFHIHNAAHDKNKNQIYMNCQSHSRRALFRVII